MVVVSYGVADEAYAEAEAALVALLKSKRRVCPTSAPTRLRTKRRGSSSRAAKPRASAKAHKRGHNCSTMTCGGSRSSGCGSRRGGMADGRHCPRQAGKAASRSAQVLKTPGW